MIIIFIFSIDSVHLIVLEILFIFSHDTVLLILVAILFIFSRHCLFNPIGYPLHIFSRHCPFNPIGNSLYICSRHCPFNPIRHPLYIFSRHCPFKSDCCCGVGVPHPAGEGLSSDRTRDLLHTVRVRVLDQERGAQCKQAIKCAMMVFNFLKICIKKIDNNLTLILAEEGGGG